MSNIYREIPPLKQQDCFMVFDRKKDKFDFPIHIHDEFELNFIDGGKGVKRIVGDNITEIGNLELVLMGANLPHGWFMHECKNKSIHEITIQFHRDLFDEKFLQRNHLFFIKTLLERSSRGISFSKETIEMVKPRLTTLNQKSGFDSVLEFIGILHELSIAPQMQTLASASFVNENFSYNSRRIEKAFEHMKSNYEKNITLNEMAKIVNMTEVGFSRFIKKRTGKTFIDSLNDIRLGHSSRYLIETTLTVAELSFLCGFNNLSYFNRIFKKKHHCTPKEFRKNYSGTHTYV